MSATPKVYNFARAARSLYLDDGCCTKMQEYTRPFEEVESSLGLLSEAVTDLEATAMANEPQTALKLVRLAEFVSPGEWVRPLNEWKPPEAPLFSSKADLSDSSQRRQLLAEEQFDSLVKHLLLQFEDAPRALLDAFSPFHGSKPAQHWARAESPFLSEDAWMLSYRFARVLVEVGAGQSAAKALKANVSPKISKPMAHAFMQSPTELGNPVKALRTAQVTAQGGSDSLADEARSSVLGFTLGDHEHEDFAQSLLLWMADRESELTQVKQASVIDHLVASYEGARMEGKDFTMKGRTVNAVLKAAGDAYEKFFPSGFESMQFASQDESGKACTVIVSEVLSVDKLVMAGVEMQNCLRTMRGVYKYTARARSRSSSFWTISYSYADKPEEEAEDQRRYVLIFEVWNQSRIIHQAEGTGSSIPAQHALQHMSVWAEAQRVDWTTWEVW